jgi:hypothetical protein
MGPLYSLPGPEGQHLICIVRNAFDSPESRKTGCLFRVLGHTLWILFTLADDQPGEP